MYSLNKIIKTISLIALTLGCFGLSPQARAVSGDDTVNHHIWQPVATLSNGATSTTAKVAAPSQSRQLFFEDRVAYQRAIEEVYWRHRIWHRGGGERPDPKPSLDAVMSQATIEQKVQDYLRSSELLEEEWQKPITPEQLQAEMERMAEHSKAPEVLRELFAALGDDPFVIAECLARPVLLERLQFATVESRKEPLESWSAKRAPEQMPIVMAAANANYTLPAISDQPNGCIDDTWTATSTTNAPTAREFHTAVWTGSEMIVWGGAGSGLLLNTGGSYNPSTDSWTVTSTTNAPSARSGHTAVWTGSEMIIWSGGFDNTGGRYNPSTNSWTATSTTNAPTVRENHTAVWTGSEMIVWGGSSSFALDTGGRYNPSTDSWTATSTANAPGARADHTAVWTGSEMIVWGGYDFNSFRYFNTGRRYNPGTDSWTPTSTTNAPSARAGHTAVWTGSQMIVWGDNSGFLNTGGRYDPSTDSWTDTTTTNAPTGREGCTAVWTGSEMIVWGGFSGSGQVNTGGRYNPGTDSWTATSTTNAPEARYLHTAVWTDSEMIVWGGLGTTLEVNTGGRYCAQAVSPTITLVSSASRKHHGNAGPFDIDLPFTGTPGVECRVGNGGTFLQTIVFTFSEAVTSVSGTTATSCGRVNNTTISSSTVTVELGHVTCDGSDITVTVPGVNGASGSVDASATMTLRTGDVNADGVVNNTDLKEIRMNVGRGLVNGDNFRDDITVDGKVNHGDTTLEKSKL